MGFTLKDKEPENPFMPCLLCHRKKFKEEDLSRDELVLAKRYPAHTALCIRDGWEFCRPKHAACFI